MNTLSSAGSDVFGGCGNQKVVSSWRKGIASRGCPMGYTLDDFDPKFLLLLRQPQTSSSPCNGLYLLYAPLFPCHDVIPNKPLLSSVASIMSLRREKKKYHSGEFPKEFGREATLLQSATAIGHSPYPLKIQKQMQKVTGAVFDLWPILDGACRSPVPMSVS